MQPDPSPVSRTDLSVQPAAWRVVYAEHFRGVWRNLRRLGVPDAALDDAVQDVFLVVHRRRLEFAGRSSLKTWIFGIVLRVAKDYRRAGRRHHALVEKYAGAMVCEPEADCPAEEAARREATRRLHAILAELNDEERAVFVLVELEQLSVQEAADAAGLKLGTCQRRLRSARTAFDKALKRQNHEAPGRRRP